MRLRADADAAPAARTDLLQTSIERDRGARQHRCLSQKAQHGDAVRALRDVIENHLGEVLRSHVNGVIGRELLGRRGVM